MGVRWLRMSYRIQGLSKMVAKLFIQVGLI